MKSTNRKDWKGKEIFVGDYVKIQSSIFKWKGSLRNVFVVRKIKFKREGNRDLYLLGDTYNIWKGKEVEVVSKKAFKKMDIPLNTDYFVDDNGEYVRVTGQHMFGYNDEEWQEHLVKMYSDAFFFTDITK